MQFFPLNVKAIMVWHKLPKNRFFKQLTWRRFFKVYHKKFQKKTCPNKITINIKRKVNIAAFSHKKIQTQNIL